MSIKKDLLAVVGIGCRFPGGIESISALVEALEGKVNTTCDVPENRWNSDFHHSSNPEARGKSYMYRGSFLKNDVSQFDPSFFGISPRDAENMDPQQRTLLEIVWEAFENTGLDLPAYGGKDVGVYVGGFMLDHMINQMSPGNRSVINQHTATGMMMTMLSNRISHVFDFRGPSLSIDTACSSSLVAFHYACQDLWRGSTKMAVVGGVNIMLRPEYPMGMCKGQFLSRDGECKSFDERADGYGRGEGAGVVVLKPLSAALADGDQVLATVVATGSNQDGHTSGISMPNGEAQRQLIEDVCDRYEIDKAAVRYVECHGTGTAIGDPTEATAIGQTYGAARQKQGIDPVVIGSIKSNIGHTEAAAGVAGVIKAVLTLMHRQTYPLANLQTPNPNIPFDDLNVKLSDDVLSLGDDQDSFLVAVNSFGYGGTNAHVVLQTAPVVVEQPAIASQLSDTAADGVSQPDDRPFPYFLPLSARNPKAIPALAGRYSKLLKDEAIALEDILYSASLKRPHLSHRAVVKGTSREELVAALDVLTTNEESDDIIQGVEPFKGHRKPVFVFTGMGPQRWNMGHELYLYSPIYRAAVEEADAAFQKAAGFSILDEMLKDEASSHISRTVIAQPANLVLQIGLLAVLRAAGIEPGAIVGHSVGELGSAYAAGVLNLEDVMTVSYHRSRLQATCAGTGGMLAIGLGKEQALDLIAHCADRVSVAAVNSPSSVTLAGDSEELEKLSAALTEEGTFNRLLTVEVPYHSPMMDPIMQPMIEAMAHIRPQVPQVTLYSTVTGAKVEGISYDAEYWTRNARQSVEFATAIAAILEDGYNTFLEIGPHPVLANSMRDCIRALDRDCRTIFTLNRKTPELDTLYRGIVSVHTSGCEMDWSIHNGNGRWTQLPNYPWQREQLWVENERAAQDRLAPIQTPILGLQEAPATPAWRNDFEHESLTYLKDHVVTGVPILPAAAYIEALLEVLQAQNAEQAALIIRDLKIFAPILLSSERALDGVTTYDPFSKSATIRSLTNGALGNGQIHITSKLAIAKNCVPQIQDLQVLLAAADDAVDVQDFYQRLDRLNLSYGPAFQTIREMHVNFQDRQVMSRIEMAPTLADALEGYVIHPTVLDACFQTQVSLLKVLETTYLPTGFQEMCVYASQLPANVWCLTELVEQTDRHILCDISLFGDDGQLLAIIRGMRSTAAVKQERVDRFGDPVKRQILTYDWSYGESLTEPKRLGYWLVVGADAELTQKASGNLEQYGAIQSFPVVLASSSDDESLVDLGDEVTVAHVETAVDAARVLEQYSSLDGIVFLHGLAATTESDDPTGEVAISQLIAFSQALLQRDKTRRPRIYAVTQGAFAVNEHETMVQPSQSAINGFVRVAFNELEGVRFSSIDLPQKLSSEIWDSLIMELLCDSRHDEVALRGTFRLVSEMIDSPVLTEDRIQYATIDDDHPIQVRPLNDEAESMGVARMLALTPTSLGTNDIQLRIEATLAPYRLLTEDPDLHDGQSLIEVIAEVTAVGPEVSDLTPGMRVCGYAPVDISSHITGHRDQFVLVPIAPDANASRLVSTIGLATRAQLAIAALDAQKNDTALIYADPLGLVVANILDRQGVQVTLTSEAKDTLEFKVLDRYPVVPFCPEEINAALEQTTATQGFDLLVAPLTHWTQTFDFRTLCQGGSIIDTDSQSAPIALGQHQLARTDLTMYLKRRDRLQTVLATVVDQIEQGYIMPLQHLTVSVHDVAWQKLGLSADIPAVTLTFDTQGQDLPVVQQDRMSMDTEGTYLITGGFGGFGQKTAEWLVGKGVHYLVLTGRSGANTPERQAFVQTLSDRGVEVKAAACDTADLQALNDLFDDIQQTMPPLKGVFHSGALILDQPIESIDADTYQKVMRSKALGAWNLHQLTQSLPLDYFVMYSSIANLVGNARQASYSAANGFLNGLAHMRRIQGLAATSVNWGAIADVGVVAQDETLEQFLRYTGLRGIRSTEALDVLETALAREVTQFGVSMISSWADWSRYETRGATSPRFQTLIALDTQDQDDSMRSVLMEELSPLDIEEQVELLGSLLLEIIASVLKADPEGIPLDTPVSQLGIDSLMATELQLQIDAKLGLSISIMELLGDVTVRAFARSSLTSLFEMEAVAA